MCYKFLSINICSCLFFFFPRMNESYLAPKYMCWETSIQASHPRWKSAAAPTLVNSKTIGVQRKWHIVDIRESSVNCITRWVSRLVLVLVWYWDNQINRDSWPFSWSKQQTSDSTYVSATVNLCYLSRYSSAKTDQNHVLDALHYGLSSTSIKPKRSRINKSQICPSLQIKYSNIPMCCFQLNFTKLCLQCHLFPRNYYWVAPPVCARLLLQMCKAPTQSTWYSNRK